MMFLSSLFDPAVSLVTHILLNHEATLVTKSCSLGEALKASIVTFYIQPNTQLIL